MGNFPKKEFSIYVGELDSSVTEEKLKQFFEDCDFGESLSDISIYTNWSITSSQSEIPANDWFIDSAKNNGYPQLIYNNYVMHKLMPNNIFITPKKII